MAVYIKGDPVANATSYKLLEKKGGDYTNLTEASEINFEVSALGLAVGDHTLVVKASASGYADSDYSNEVLYTVERLGSYWIAEDLTGNAIGTGTPSLYLGNQYFFIDNTAYVSMLEGKTIESIAVCTSSKLTNGSGTVTLYLVDLSNTAPASNWTLKESVSFSGAEASSIVTVDLKTPFVVPSGYTIGYKSGQLGAGTVVNGHTRTEKYYEDTTTTERKNINMAPIDFKVKA